jgi:hypothetical protein
MLAWHFVKIYAWVVGLVGQHEMSQLCDDHARAMKDWPVKKVPDL